MAPRRQAAADQTKLRAPKLLVVLVGLRRRATLGTRTEGAPNLKPAGLSVPGQGRSLSRYCLGDMPVACLKATQKLLDLW